MRKTKGMQTMEQTFFAADQLCDAVYKDNTPEGTVARIQSLLRSHGIETQEQWVESNVPNCYTLRVTVVGTTFGTNGKGVTKAFARASGYGELMERMQLGYLASGVNHKDGVFTVNDSQNEVIPAKNLLKRNRNWYELLSQRLNWATGENTSAEQILMQYADEHGNIAAAPYYNLTTGTKEYFPTTLRKAVYNANGCAAGNSPEEAIVQGISEAVERNHQLRLIAEDITPPDVPESALEACPVAYGIITFLREKGFRVLVKDCSLGMDFPVICVVIIDPKTGRYRTNFGAFPIFEIALQRTLTESFQGRNPDNVARNENFLCGKGQVLDLKNLSIELTQGGGEKQPALFFGTPGYEFRENIGLKGEGNRELLRACVAYFRDMDRDILVRDGSCLGFPTYQVLIPGYSEIFSHRLSAKHNDRSCVAYAQKVLRNPAAAKPEDIMGLYMHMKWTAKLDQRTNNVHGFTAGAGISADLSPREDAYLMAASLACVSYTMGRYGETVSQIERMLPAAPEQDREYLICLKRYLSLILNGWKPAAIKDFLLLFHNADTVQKLFACLEEKRNPMANFTLRCDGICREDCPLRHGCRKVRVDELAKKINDKTRELDFDTMARSLEALLRN